MAPEIIQTEIKGLILFKPMAFKDGRGYFTETYNEAGFEKIGIRDKFIQDNQSFSQKGALRGLHFQKPPFAQAKLVRVVSGSVLDIVVDIRKNSETYGRHHAIELSGDNFLQLYIPEGFAHGFCTLEDDTVFAYKCTAYYNKEAESGLPWNDKTLGINWGIAEPVLSEKDKNFGAFKDFESPFF